MSGKQETSADIIAEMRGARTEFPFVYLMGEPDTPEVIDCRTKKIIEPRKMNIRRVTVKELADRLEAALGREREASGNAAKLREAIEAVLLAFNYGESTIVNQLPFSKLLPVLRKCAEALAEPSRNCDVYTANELKVKFSCELVSELPIANEHEKNLVTITAMGVIDTLFATTKEGGAE